MRFLKKTITLMAVSALLVGCTPTVTPTPTVDDPSLVVPPTTQPTVQPDPSGDPLYSEPTEGIALVPLSTAWKQQVEEDWAAATGTDLGAWENVVEHVDGIRYYGCYNGYEILFRPTGDDAVTDLEIENVTFSHTTTFEIFAYQDGEFIPIKDLAEQGELTNGNLVELVAVHRAYGRSSIDPEGPVVTLETLELMKVAFLNQFVRDEQYTTADLSVVYLGEYSGAHVGFINGILMYTQALTSDNIDGVIFRYNTGQKIQVFFEGELMGLPEAYERGILSRDDLLAIQKEHNPQPDNLVTK